MSNYNMMITSFIKHLKKLSPTGTEEGDIKQVIDTLEWASNGFKRYLDEVLQRRRSSGEQDPAPSLATRLY